MKKGLILLFFAFVQLILVNCFAQAPNAIPYQGVSGQVGTIFANSSLVVV